MVEHEAFNLGVLGSIPSELIMTTYEELLAHYTSVALREIVRKELTFINRHFHTSRDSARSQADTAILIGEETARAIWSRVNNDKPLTE